MFPAVEGYFCSLLKSSFIFNRSFLNFFDTLSYPNC